MKPNFALILSFEGIGLLHRVKGGWHLVGEVMLDSADMAGDLGGLAAKARALDPTGLRTKLVIPEEQIRYMTIEAPERDVGRIEAAVRAALDGATPYALADLSWDWSVRGGTVHVAAVARETLAEAEAFAVEHGFNPYSFVAMPGEGAFAGEPFFGETAHAARVLGPDEAVDREAEVIRILGAAHLPEPEAPPEPETTPDTPAGTGEDVPEAPPEVPVEPQVDTTADKPPDGRRGRGGKKRRKAGVAAGIAAPVAFSSSREAGPPPPRAGEGPKVPLPKARFSAPPVATDPAPKAPPVLSAAPAPDAATEATGPAAAPSSVRPSAAPGRGGFLSRRKPSGAGHGRAKAESADTTAKPGAPATAGAQPMATTTTLDEAQRLTVFGARRTDGAAPARQPRYFALVLTAALLLLLVAIAAWSALFLDDGISGLFRSGDRVQTAEEMQATGSEPDTASQASEPVPLPETTAGATPPATVPVAVPEVLSPDEARARYAATGIWQMAPEPPLSPVVPERQAPALVGPDEAVRFGDIAGLPGAGALLTADRRPPAHGGPAQRTPEPALTADGASDATDSADVAAAVAAALTETPDTPTPATDPEPEVTDPPRDARGLVAATPEGVRTPDGITVFAGAPPLRPPATPPRAAPVVLGDPTAAAPQEPTLRPRERPRDLSDGRDRTDLDTTGRTEEAVLRPRPRPAGMDAIVAAATEAAAAEPVSTDQRLEVDIPTTATVARAATDRNQISLRQVNLIGVYGGTDDRRALVRLANGRYRKVQVGDRLDGGQVAAIGDDELRYVKRGRSVVLKMPKG